MTQGKNLDRDFLAAACATPWSWVDIAGAETIGKGHNLMRANHVHVMCPTPFVLAAFSVREPGRCERHGIRLIRDADEVDQFLRAPWRPHYRSHMVSLVDSAHDGFADFMDFGKTYSVLRKRVASRGLSTAELEYGIVVRGRQKRVAVYADVIVPMRVCVAVDEY
ncbi:hypothetical protein LF41_2283 [Lysobacter dokdonensis DS-58]|uniref:Uncharacterized protein n=1 Tax=Lysobacter dokdonensis DS-58 TaxID=1300345 RepID=A0A0A2WHX1_9GAMM|nr:hypothetical protein [Lysobacter dokdonensis]KGQ19781.1 hypothetical protein LF41_2283 [Lysobacter dokdonensis DS-58]